MNFKICALLLTMMSLQVNADSVKLIADGPTALAAMVKAIESAQSSVNMVYYVFNPADSSTKIIVDALKKKRAEGKSVRLVLDTYDMDSRNPGNSNALAGALQAAHIDVKYFGQHAFALSNMYHLHIKLLVIDGEKAIVGSRNIGDEHFGLRKEFNYTDRDVLIEGPAAAQVLATFKELYVNSSAPAAATPPAGFLALGAREQEILRYLDHEGFAAAESLPARTCSSVRFVSDNPNFTKIGTCAVNFDAPECALGDMPPEQFREKRASAAFVDFISHADRLNIENWVYMPDLRINDTFAALRARKVPVEVITNKNAFTGGQFDQAVDLCVSASAKRDTTGSEKVYQISHEGGFTRASSLTPSNAPWSIHQKVALRTKGGRHDILLGSFNIDSRSYLTNLEDVAIIEGCEDLSRDFEAENARLKEDLNRDANCSRCKPEQGNFTCGLGKFF